MEELTFAQKMGRIFKKYGYFMLLGVLVVAIVLTLVIVGVSSNKRSVTDVPTSSQVSPYLPVLNATIFKGYFGDQLEYNEDLRQWETHNGIDLQASAGSKVFAILDGTVEDVYNDDLEGCVVVIKHDNGLESTYASLDSNVLVSKGDSVNRGQELGTIGDTASSEISAGAHLHFGLKDNGKKIDPASYLNIGTK